MDTTGFSSIVAIGPCTVPSCHRPATLHLLLGEWPRQIAGTVCDECAELTRRAAFLLDMSAA